MSRVVYTDTPATAEQEALRREHGVRVVTDAEEGVGLDALPEGVYGFTYSPALPNAPLFAVRRYRSYETHKVPSGEACIVGFAPPDTARQLQSADREMTVVIQPEPDNEATALVTIPYARIRHHRQYAAPNQHGFTVTLVPLGSPRS
jgi:hypothetical protein